MRAMRGARLAAGIITAHLFTAHAAHAQGRPHLELTYLPGGASCPTERSFRGGVAARLGYDPFTDGAPAGLAVVLRRAATGFLATIAVYGDAAPRVLRARSCAEVAAAAELVVALAIDPLATGSAPESMPVSMPATAPAYRPVSAPSSLAPPAIVGITAVLGTAGAAGELPAPAWAGLLGVRARRGHAALGVDLRLDAPVGRIAAVGSVRSSLWMATASACLAADRLSGCGLLGGGVYRATPAGIAGGRAATSLLVESGVRFGLDQPLGRRLFLRSELDLLVPLVHTALRAEGAVLWNSPPVAALLGVSLGVRFP